MTNRRFPTSPALAILAATTLSLITVLPVSATSLAMPLHGAQPVTVNISFSTRLPLVDLSEETLTASQKSGRSFIYRLARDECAVLKTIIAETCRLTSLNVSAQIQHQNNQNPVVLYINGNAHFAIGLKTDTVE